jgi:hypothetical protein
MPMCMCSIGRTTLAVPLATLVVSTLVVFAWPASAHAATDCVAAPNATAPQGSRWYYRRDPETKRRCWFIAAQGQRTIRKVARVTRVKARVERRVTQPAVQRPAAPTGRETAQPIAPSKLHELIYGTEQDVADVPAREELSLRPSQGMIMADNAQPTAAVVALSAARHDASDDSADEPLVVAALPQAITARSNARLATTAGVAPETLGQMLFVAIVTLAVAGSMLYASVRLVLARRRRVLVDRRRSYPFGRALVYDPSPGGLANPDDYASAIAKTGRYAA